ncbi:conserved protein of unknown function (plasmid) [Agreia sp. COWG]|nr:conserved protein of unknown function [Agreia sp. COWG]
MAHDRARQHDAFSRINRFQVQRSGLGAPVRDAFFTAVREDNAYHPLARLINARAGSGGGRGGRTRVLLYLSLLWVASGGEHTSQRPASFWADLLGLPDPMGAGSRAIRSNWDELEQRGFVSIVRADVSGDPPIVRALKEDGSGDRYTIPTGRTGDTYRRVPEAAWRSLLHETGLSGPGLCMYLVSLRTFGQTRGGALTFPRSYFRREYGMGESTRKAGLRNLVDLGVLQEEGVSIETGSGGPRLRGRTQYTLLQIYEPPAPVTPNAVTKAD